MAIRRMLRERPLLGQDIEGEVGVERVEAKTAGKVILTLSDGSTYKTKNVILERGWNTINRGQLSKGELVFERPRKVSLGKERCYISDESP